MPPSLFSPQTSNQVLTPSYWERWERVTHPKWSNFHRLWWGGESRLKGVVDKQLHERFLVDGLDAVAQYLEVAFEAGSSFLVREEHLIFTERFRNARAEPLKGVVLLGQPGIGKSLYLLFLLMDCMTREEPVLFTTTSGKTYLFDRDGVARVMTANFIPEDYLPDFVDNASRIWSLVDCPEKKELVPSRVSIHAPQLFFVAASSADDSRYRHLLKKPSVHCWWMSYWNNDEILALLRTAQRDRNYRVINAAAVKSLVSEAGPCPRDIFEFLADPDGHRATVRQAVKSYHAQPRTVTRPLYHASHENRDGHTITFTIRMSPLSPFVFTSDSCAIVFKTRAIYEQMLDALLPFSGPSGVMGAWWLHDSSTIMGRAGVGSVPFLYDQFAAGYTLGQFPADALRYPFAPMTSASPESESGNTTSQTRFIYRQPEDAYGYRGCPLVLVVHDDQTTSWQMSSPPQPQVIAPSTFHLPEAAAPWCARRLVLYENIHDLAIDDASYYLPTAAVRERNASFNAFFFQVVPRRDATVIVTLWVLQVIAKRDPDWACTPLRTSNDSNPTKSDFDTIRQLRERARRAWQSTPGLVDVEVKYVLVVPHNPQCQRQDSRFDVEWRLPVEFEAQRGKVFVQFLDISSFCGDCVLRGGSRDLDVLDKCGVEDVIGSRVPPLTAPRPSGPPCAPSVEAVGADGMDVSIKTMGKRVREEMEADDGRGAEGEEGKIVSKKAKATTRN